MIIGTGIDLIEIERIKEASQNKAFLDRVFTETEIEYFKSKNFNPQSIAGVFAAKEAVSKALGLGIGEISWHDIIIHHDGNGAPFVGLSESSTQALNAKHGNMRLHVSITHSRSDACAFAVAERVNE